MANIRLIQRRIKSVKNTAKITKAMEMIATSKMKKAQDRVIAGRPYSEKLKEVLERNQKILLGRIRRAKENRRFGGSQSEAMSVLHTRSKLQIKEIKRALRRMDKGMYGVCANCNQPIRFERLMALPTTPLCIDCQDKKDFG